MNMKLRELIERFNRAMGRAEEAGLHLPNGMTLATVGADGRPSSRVVLLKGADERGFSFYTNIDSRKARELRDDPRASICIWWPALEEQVRVDGSVEPVGDEEADAYWATRPRGSQLGAWASRQSEPLSSHEDLRARFEKLQDDFDGRTIPRPEFWSGYRLVPDRIEFWKGRDDRLNERELFTRTADGWEMTLLNP
jgi:pyridoxamine 5'-phosphate oxidase